MWIVCKKMIGMKYQALFVFKAALLKLWKCCQQLYFADTLTHSLLVVIFFYNLS